MKEETVTMTVRVPVGLKTSFDEVCKRNDVTGSQILRAAMRQYVKENAQADLFGRGGKK